MSGEPQNYNPPADPAQGGATARGLDMTDERDRGLARRAFGGNGHKRWGVTDADKGDFLKALRVALRYAIEAKDNRGIRGCVDTLVKIEGQIQADEHLDDKNARIDGGRATEAIGFVGGREAAKKILSDPALVEKARLLSEAIDAAQPD